MLTSWEAKFISSLEIVVKRRSSIKVTIEEEWLTEKEMKDDYGWNPSSPECTGLPYYAYIYVYIYIYIYLFIYIYICWFVPISLYTKHLYLFTSQIQFEILNLRSRIAGAKKACQAKADTHVRTANPFKPIFKVFNCQFSIVNRSTYIYIYIHMCTCIYIYIYRLHFDQSMLDQSIEYRVTLPDSFAGRTATINRRSSTWSSRRKANANRNRWKRKPRRKQRVWRTSIHHVHYLCSGFLKL